MGKGLGLWFSGRALFRHAGGPGFGSQYPRHVVVGVVEDFLVSDVAILWYY